MDRLRQYAQLSPDSAWNEVGCDLYDEGDFEDAVSCFQRSVEEGNSTAWLNLGNSLRELGREPEAAVAFRRAIAEGEQDALLNLGDVLLALDEQGEARIVLEEASSSGDRTAHLYLARLFATQGEVDSALAAYEVARRSGVAAATGELGIYLYDLGRDEEAEPLLASCADEDADCRASLGDLLRRSGRIEDALRLLEEGVRLQQVEAYIPYASALLEQGRSVEAEAILREAAARGDSYAHLNLGLIHEQAGRPLQALQEYVLGQTAGDREATAALSRLRDQSAHDGRR